jgi:hypothetical protein
VIMNNELMNNEKTKAGLEALAGRSATSSG